jgi:hypothetical protein
MSNFLWAYPSADRPAHPNVISVGEGTPKVLREEAYRWNAALILPIPGCGNKASYRETPDGFLKRTGARAVATWDAIGYSYRVRGPLK